MNQKGQSLIEVLAVLSIAVIVVSAVSISVITALSSARINKEKTLATQKAQDAMEVVKRVKVTNYSSLNSLSGSYCFNVACAKNTNDISSCLLQKGPSGCPVNESIYSSDIMFEKDSPSCNLNQSPTPGPTPAGGSENGTKVTVIMGWRNGKSQLVSCVTKASFIPLAPQTIVLTTVIPTSPSGSSGGVESPPSPVPTIVVTATSTPVPPTNTPIPPSPTWAYAYNSCYSADMSINACDNMGCSFYACSGQCWPSGTSLEIGCNYLKPFCEAHHGDRNGCISDTDHRCAWYACTSQCHPRGWVYSCP